MRSRCNNPKSHEYRLYGGRGISVCKEWDNYLDFKEWSTTHGYANDLTIDRIDVNGDYCPQNCRWVTWKEQGRNKRANHMLTYNGVTKTMVEWSEETGIPYHTLKGRINCYHFSVEEALTLPVHNGNNQTLRREKTNG